MNCTLINRVHLYGLELDHIIVGCHVTLAQSITYLLDIKPKILKKLQIFTKRFKYTFRWLLLCEESPSPIPYQMWTWSVPLPVLKGEQHLPLAGVNLQPLPESGWNLAMPTNAHNVVIPKLRRQTTPLNVHLPELLSLNADFSTLMVEISHS